MVGQRNEGCGEALRLHVWRDRAFTLDPPTRCTRLGLYGAQSGQPGDEGGTVEPGFWCRNVGDRASGQLQLPKPIGDRLVELDAEVEQRDHAIALGLLLTPLGIRGDRRGADELPRSEGGGVRSEPTEKVEAAVGVDEVGSPPAQPGRLAGPGDQELKAEDLIENGLGGSAQGGLGRRSVYNRVSPNQPAHAQLPCRSA